MQCIDIPVVCPLYVPAQDPLPFSAGHRTCQQGWVQAAT